jgi:hypothetical protein
MLASDEISQIVYDVSTDIPDHGSASGIFIIGRQRGEFFFQWKMYRNAQKPDSTDIPELFIKATNLQKLIVNYQTSDCYIALATQTPAETRKFSFPAAVSLQVIQVIQILALKSAEINPSARHEGEMGEWVDYIYDSLVANQKSYRLMEIPVEGGKFSIPQAFSIDGTKGSKKKVIVSPAMQILTQFEVRGDEHINNSVKPSDLPTFKVFTDLRAAIEVRGLDPDIRFIAWPVLLNILPFEGAIQDVLAKRVQEYQSVRSQWESMPKAQIKYNPLIKEAYATIRVDVKRTYPPPSVEPLEFNAGIKIVRDLEFGREVHTGV